MPCRDQRHCTVCTRTYLTADEPQTCTPCVGQARRDLHTITDLVALAHNQLDGWPARSPSAPSNGPRSSDTTLPGGDLLVALGPGSDGRSETGETWSPSDPISVVWLLGQWQHDWRRHLGLADASDGQLTTVSRFLDHHTGWAGQNHPAFGDYTNDLHRLRTQLETALRAGDQPDHTGVPCLDCAGQLVQKWLPSGLDDNRTCQHCRRVYTPGEYWHAVRAQLEGSS